MSFTGLVYCLLNSKCPNFLFLEFGPPSLKRGIEIFSAFKNPLFFINYYIKLNLNFREAKGWCVTHLQVSHSTLIKGRRYEVVFLKIDETPIVCSLDSGQTVVVSNDSHLAIAMGTITEVTPTTIAVKLDKYVQGNLS